MTEHISVTLCVDALAQRMGGIGRYTWELSQRLPKQDAIGKIHYVVRDRLVDEPSVLLHRKMKPRGRLGRLLNRSVAGKVMRSSLVHSPNYFLPRAAPSGIITVHDLSVFRYPETHPVERVRQFESLFAHSLKRARHIITDTETIRHELSGMFGVPLTRVTAVALGVNQCFRPAQSSEVAATLSVWGLRPGHYGLCVAALEPRKKIQELLRTWRRLPNRLRDEIPLVVTGGLGWNNDLLRDDLACGQRDGWVRHLGHVSEVDLPALYAGASLFIYPSVYEGFGLPPLEAMASGIPVIASDSSCVVEVCGDAAKYVAPEDDNAFLATILQGLEDEQWREAAVRKGLERAWRFSWERCAKETVSVYQSALKS